MTSSTITKEKNILYKSIGIIAIFLIWLFLEIIIDNEIILPSIQTVFKQLLKLFITSLTYKIILYTLIRITISLLLGIFLGIIFGVLSSISNIIYSVLSPIIKIMRALPIASIILIILILFGMNGFGDITFSPIIVTMLLVTPIVYEAVYKGIKNIDKNLIDVALLETNKKKDLIQYTYLPLIRNEFSIGLAQSIGLAFKSMVMAEYISQTQTSIGFALLNSKTYLEYDKVFAWTIILIVLSICFDSISSLLFKKK